MAYDINNILKLAIEFKEAVSDLLENIEKVEHTFDEAVTNITGKHKVVDPEVQKSSLAATDRLDDILGGFELWKRNKQVNMTLDSDDEALIRWVEYNE